MKKLTASKAVVSSEKPRRKSWVMAGFVVILAAVVVGVVLWQNHDKPSSDNPTTNPTLQSLYAGNLSIEDPATHDKLVKALSAAGNKTDKIALLNALASNSLSNKHYQQAVDYAVQARDAGDKTSQTALGIAQNYEDNLHNKSKALDYYRAALSSAKTEKKQQTNPYADSLITYIEDKLTTLGGQ